MRRLVPAILLVALLSMFSAPVMAASSTLVISTNSGTLYFPGENAVVFFTTTANNVAVNPDTIGVTLYLPGNVNNFALTPTQVTTGVFYVSYPLPTSALTGLYSVVITASYQSGAFQGMTVTGFQVSQGMLNVQSSILDAIGSLSSQLSSTQSSMLAMIASTRAAFNSVNSSMASQVARMQTSVAGLGTSVSNLGISVSNIGANLQGPLVTSQNAITGAVNQGTSSVQGSITNAQNALTSAISSAGGTTSASTASTTNSLNSILNLEYYILALTAIVFILAIVLLVYKRK